MDAATPGPQRMRYSFESRCRAVAAMVGGMSPGAAAQAVGASRATGYRWWRRYTTAGWVGLQERPSTPKHQPRRLSPAAEAEILAARQRSGAGPVTLGALLGHPASTVGKVLRRLGHSRRPRAPRPPVVRDERAHPGELLAPRHQEVGPLLARNRQAHHPRRHPAQPRRRAGSTCTWPSTTTRGWPTPDRGGPVTARATPWPSWSARGPGSAPRASRCRR